MLLQREQAPIAQWLEQRAYTSSVPDKHMVLGSNPSGGTAARPRESSTALPVVIQVDDLLVPGVVVAVLGTAMGSAATHALLALLAGLGLLALVTWTASGGLTRHWLHHTTEGQRRADGDADG